MSELEIRNGTVVAMDEAGTVVNDGLVRISDGRIAYVGPREGAPPFAGGETLDAGGGLILPGLINCHTHAAMTLMRGLADDLPLDIWLTQHIFPLEANLEPEDVHAGTMLACLEMIKGGTTSFSDMYLFAPQVAKATDQAGMRAVIGEVIYDFPSPGYGELDNGFRVTEELIRTYADHPRISGVVMPHALYTCARSLLERAARLADDLGAQVNTHLAENTAETAQVTQLHGDRPLKVLEQVGLLTDRTCLDHCVDLNQAEIERLARAGARVAHCPESNMKLANGVAPLPEMIEVGVAVGLGTDGCASNNNLDLLGEMDTCAKLQKVHRLDPTAAPAEMVASLATRRGGASLGFPGELGVLKAGALGDVIVIDTDRPHMTPMYNPYSHLVYTARGGDVRHSVIHGRVVMQDRQVLTLDQAEVLAKARERAAGLIKRAGLA